MTTNKRSHQILTPHGGYRNLRSFQVAQLVYDLTVRFCDRYVDRFCRTKDQMVQAARSGVQNIAEGSQASGTSKKMELKLTNVARASLEELRLDFEDFLRQRGLALWPREDPRRQELVDRRCRTAGEVAQWVERKYRDGRAGPSGQRPKSRRGGRGRAEDFASYPEIAANAALVLIAVACSLLDRQIKALAQAFEDQGGFTERLYRARTSKRHRS